jgi:poly(3-hydroxybutyrate) depolymerase
MLYEAYQTQSDVMMPLRMAAYAARGMMRPFLTDNPFARTFSAACELVSRAGLSHTRPPFGIESILVENEEVAVEERAVVEDPFCTLLHLRKDTIVEQPKVLVVAPMSGHFSTLLRGTVRTLMQDHDVFVTDWHNARNVSLVHGKFDFDDYVDYVIRYLQHLGPGTNVVAVCQPAVPVLVAAALMAADQDPAQPATMTLMGGPIDTRVNMTAVNELAMNKPLEWFERNVISMVPLRYPGAFRRVYPGFLQITGFMTMNLDRHITAHSDLFRHLIKGDGESAEATKAFYDEYLAVMDLPAEFYLQTLVNVFQKQSLAKGELVSRDRKVEPQAIRRTALLTIEGERDDICGIGQTYAAHGICSGLPARKRGHYLQPKVGHYGVFNGKRWQNEIYPRVRDFIQLHA